MEEENFERLINSKENNGDNTLDLTLRPQTISDYVGQKKIKESISITIEAAKGRNEAIEHVLLYGAPGLGKTTLAHLISKEMEANIRVTTGPAIEKSGDLAAILSNLEEGDILFIDEIHRLNKTIEEILYPAMEDYALDIVIGKGPGAKTVRIDLPRFTIIGATTKVSLLSSPLRDRFGIHHHLNFYEPEDIKKIVERSAGILGVDIEKDSAAAIAGRSRRTPRVANRLLKRVRDYCAVKGNGRLDPFSCEEAFNMMEIDHIGLDHVDKKILDTIINKFSGGPVGLNTIAAATGEEAATIEDVCEPYLMQLGFLDRSPRGRLATRLAYEHLGKQKPGQDSLV